MQKKREEAVKASASSSSSESDRLESESDGWTESEADGEGEDEKVPIAFSLGQKSLPAGINIKNTKVNIKDVNWAETAAKPWSFTEYPGVCASVWFQSQSGLLWLGIANCPVGFIQVSAATLDMASMQFEGIFTPLVHSLDNDIEAIKKEGAANAKTKLAKGLVDGVTDFQQAFNDACMQMQAALALGRQVFGTFADKSAAIVAKKAN